MRSVKNKYTKYITTLGPTGTDAEIMAKKIGMKIILKPSFPEAIEYAFQKDTYALLPCGYKKVERNHIIETWVDLNFRYLGKMRILKVYCENVKTMGIAIRNDCKKPKTLVIHPATEEFSNKIKSPVITYYVNSKPEAVRLTAEGRYDMCIGSEDIIEKYTNLKIVETFKPQMVWALYQKNKI